MYKDFFLFLLLSPDSAGDEWLQYFKDLPVIIYFRNKLNALRTMMQQHCSIIWSVCGGFDMTPDDLGQEQRKTPTLRPIEQAAVFWHPTLPTLPDGGLITATARSPDPCIIPAYVDTMENAKLCISLDLSVTLLFAYSICHAPFTILFKRQHVGAYCTQPLQKFTEKLPAVT